MIYLLVFLFITVLLISIPHRRASWITSWIVMLFNVTVSSWLALEILISGESIGIITDNTIINQIVSNLICDKLSAFFILVINFTVVTGFLYASGYLKPYIEKKPAIWIKLHYLSLVILHASMILVLLFRDGTKFLVVWELMTLSSFMLVIFDYDVKGTVKAAINYLVQMHIGMLFILGGLVMSSHGFNTLSFDNLSIWFKNNPNWPVFMLFFIGFGLKAGFFFLHTWLPDAHPAAPSHVSGVMSGVMIKLGIYGILRVGSYLQGNLDGIGFTVIILSALTGLFGVMMAILQHDIKKLLAYHSIENIGIIGLGIGLGIYGRAINNDIVSAAGFAGALLHVLNHSLFKSLLFYSAGSVIQQIHTRNVEKMGGLIKFMPYTAAAFLIGALAISGLPPFNGFISEFLIYFSIFHGLTDASFYPLTLLFVAMISLVLIGGLALICFTKVFGIVFLGQARSAYPHRPVEVSGNMLGSKIFAIIPIVLIGCLPILAINPLLNIVNELFSIDTSTFKTDIILPFNYISTGVLLLLGSIVTLSLIRYFAFLRKSISSGPTWGCGYVAVNEKQQYTSTSFVQEYATLIKPVIKTGITKIKFSDDEVFPLKREFHSHSDDFVRSKLINRPVTYMVNILRKAAIFQTGKLQHYVLYALLFLVFIFLLTYLNLI